MLVLHIKEHSSIRRPITVNSTYSQVSMDMIQPELLISTQMQWSNTTLICNDSPKPALFLMHCTLSPSSSSSQCLFSFTLKVRIFTGILIHCSSSGVTKRSCWQSYQASSLWTNLWNNESIKLLLINQLFHPPPAPIIFICPHKPC